MRFEQEALNKNSTINTIITIITFNIMFTINFIKNSTLNTIITINIINTVITKTALTQI